MSSLQSSQRNSSLALRARRTTAVYQSGSGSRRLSRPSSAGASSSSSSPAFASSEITPAGASTLFAFNRNASMHENITALLALIKQMDELWFGQENANNDVSALPNVQHPLSAAARQTLADILIFNVPVISGFTNFFQSILLDYLGSYVETALNIEPAFIVTDELNNTLDYASITQRYQSLQQKIEKKQISILAAEIELETINVQLRQQNSLQKRHWQPMFKFTGNVLTTMLYILARGLTHSPYLLPVACVASILIRFLVNYADNQFKHALSTAIINKHDPHFNAAPTTHLTHLRNSNSLTNLVQSAPNQFADITEKTKTKNKLLLIINQAISHLKSRIAINQLNLSLYNPESDLKKINEYEQIKALLNQNCDFSFIKNAFPNHLISKSLNNPYILHIYYCYAKFCDTDFQIQALHDVIRDLPIIALQNTAQSLHQLISSQTNTLIDKDIMLIIEQIGKKMLAVPAVNKETHASIIHRLLLDPLKAPFDAYGLYIEATKARKAAAAALVLRRQHRSSLLLINE